MSRNDSASTKRASSTGRRIPPRRRPGTCLLSSTSWATTHCPETDGWCERLVRQRTTLGLTQKEASLRIGVDQSTLARWERGEKEHWGKYVALAESSLSGKDEWQVGGG